MICSQIFAAIFCDETDDKVFKEINTSHCSRVFDLQLTCITPSRDSTFWIGHSDPIQKSYFRSCNVERWYKNNTRFEINSCSRRETVVTVHNMTVADDGRWQCSFDFDEKPLEIVVKVGKNKLETMHVPSSLDQSLLGKTQS